MPLRPARDRDAVAAVAPENLKDLLRLRPPQQLLKPRDVFETQFQGLRALVDVARNRLALHPIALLLEIQESVQTGGAWAASRAHVRYHGSDWLRRAPQDELKGRRRQGRKLLAPLQPRGPGITR